MAVRFSLRTAAGFTFAGCALRTGADLDPGRAGSSRAAAAGRSSADQAAESPDLAHRGQGGDPDQAAGRVEHEERERQLDEQRRGDAAPDVGVPESRITSNQASQHSRVAGDRAGRRSTIWRPRQNAQPVGGERAELDEVEPDPGALPVVGVEGTVQGERQGRRSSATSTSAGDDRDEGAHPAAARQADARNGCG